MPIIMVYRKANGPDSDLYQVHYVFNYPQNDLQFVFRSVAYGNRPIYWYETKPEGFDNNWRKYSGIYFQTL
ncbi:MAG: hypothetical protein PHI42_09230 [Paludibacteraceae bacterium]|jgi:hypothetical protein|nr:hypothetical protein [Paludibacteraceae bacterium]